MKIYALPLWYRRMLEGIDGDGDISDNALTWGDRLNARMFRADFRRHTRRLIEGHQVPRRVACETMRRAMWYAAWYATLGTSHVEFVPWTTHPTHIPQVKETA
jgi:hypothetical protein